MAGESCFRYFQNANTPFLACSTCHNHVAALQGRIQLSLLQSTFWTINISREHTVNLSVPDPPSVSHHQGCTCVKFICTMCKKLLGQTIVASYFPNDHYRREGRHIINLPQLTLWDGFQYKDAIQIMENQSAFRNLTELDASPPGTINLDNEYTENLKILSPARYSFIGGRTFVDLNCSMCMMFVGRKIVQSLSPADDFEQEGRCLLYLCNLQFWDGDGFLWAPQAMGNWTLHDNFAVFFPIPSKM